MCPVLPVAVVIPSFRRKQFLARALRSVVAQRGARPVEVIVVDDGSRDGTADVARSFGARVIEKPDNQGRPLARQDGLMGAEGAEWVAMLDDDDEWLPDHLLTLWSKRGGHVIVAGTSLSQGGGRPRSHGATSAAGEVVRSPARLMFPENSFTTSAVMVRRDILLAAGGFRPGRPAPRGPRRLAEGTGAGHRAVIAGCDLPVHRAQQPGQPRAGSDEGE